MCGIAGIIHFNQRPIVRETIERFTQSLAHRGPDGQGIWIDNEHGVAFGHRRLAILDLSEIGNQPMHFADGRYTIIFNGEIFNFLEIRKELELRGYSFRSQSDTEVILAAYHEWREAMLPKFNGMWSLVIYDRVEKQTFVARDRYGIKPFIYTIDSQRFAFASELKAFRSLQDFTPSIDLETAQFFLQYPQSVEVTVRTILKGCKKLPAGHWGVLREGHFRIQRWWNTTENLCSVPQHFEEQVEEFQLLFDDAVRLRLRSDVSVGSCLSGGFDSASVVCTLAHLGREHHSTNDRQTQDWQHTFVATFPGSALDERPLAEETIAMAGVQGHFLEVNDEHALKDIDRVLYDFDDVGLVLPTSVWQIYQELRRSGIVVSLDGHGADELMGAYKNAQSLALIDAPSWLTSPLNNVQRIKEYHAQSGVNNHGIGSIMRDSLRLSLAYHPDFAWYRIGKQQAKQFFTTMTKANPFGFLRRKEVEFHEDFTPYTSDDILPKEWDSINRELYDMFHTTLLPTILRNFDRLSMAHGIEVRMPFMDWRLVSYVMSLPSSSKVGHGLTKRVAREAMLGRIPESIRTSKVKIGFNSPTHEWFNAPMQQWVGNSAHSLGRTSLSEIIDTKKLSQYVQQYNRSHTWQWDNAMNVWKYLHLGWFEQHLSMSSFSS
jgi:asparagine synthase (glutamine-hydrolysing)